MSGYHTPSPAFRNAASYLSSSPSASQAPNATRLEIYGLFKYVTVAVKPKSPKPSIFDMAGRAKWDAWAGMGGTYGKAGQAEAEKRYLEVAKGFGWDEAVPTHASTSARAGRPEDEEINFDSDEEDLRKGPQRPRSGGGSSSAGSGLDRGLAISVSVLAQPKTANDASIHGLSVSGDAAQLKSLLDRNSNLDLNRKDEFGYTPLHLACDRGYLDVVRLLLEKGADRSIQDPDEFTPLELAEVAGRTDIVALLSASS